MIDAFKYERFVNESNRIEGIMRAPTSAELAEFGRFMGLNSVAASDLAMFVSVYQPDARMRDTEGSNVRVGNHIAPIGGPDILLGLAKILEGIDSGIGPFETHVAYENLHPFTDCNGRSGRVLWAWQVRDLSLGFLHHFYYQTLEALESETREPPNILAAG